MSEVFYLKTGETVDIRNKAWKLLKFARKNVAFN